MISEARKDGARQGLSEVEEAPSRSEQGPHASWGEMGGSEHFVQFYETEAFFLDSASRYISAGLGAGDACVAIITPEHKDGLEARLKADGLDLAAARAQGRYIWLDAADTLSQFMLDGSPEPGRFMEVVGGAVARAAADAPHVRALGEMVALLWAEGNRVAAIRLEELWNDLRDVGAPFSLYCAYPMRDCAGEAREEQFGEVCRQHSRAIPDESYTALTTPEERLRAITLLQQKASSLEAEIAERKAAEEELAQALERERAARAEAEAANVRMDEFLGIAGHELRTPLTTIRANTQLLGRRLAALSGPQGADGADQVRTLDQARGLLVRMDGSAKRLGRLVDDLLDVSRSKAGKLELRLERADLAEIVREVVDEQRKVHPERTIRLAQPPHRAAMPVMADADRLGQVVTNYLGNALKYSPAEEPVAVEVCAEGDLVRVLVRDRGPGIPAAERERIWELFYRASTSEEPGGSRMGMGLGLHISRTIVERHGGAVGVESVPGRGSTLWFSVPLAGRAASRGE
jgi:signal transduction histidine kinase